MSLKKIKLVVFAPILLLMLFGSVPAYSQSTQTGSFGIEATIPTDPPKTAATISIPANGQSFTDLPINVTGTCPGDVLVKLFKNNIFSGSAQCSGGSYTITTDLFNGSNELIAKVFDALDQEGPESNKTTVTYTKTGFNNNLPIVSLTSSFAKRGANPGETLVWPIILSGGSGPYAISVDWGDGENDLLSREFAGAVDISHTYASPGVYRILVKATDSGGAVAFLQLVGIANGPLSQDKNVNETAASVIVKEKVVWWPLIVAAAFICISFWLGRRHQLESLRRQSEDEINY